jgi:hypothetical protein
VPITRSTFETQQRDEAEEYFARAYKVSLSMDTPSGGLWRYHRLDAGRFALDTIAAPMHLVYEAVYESSVMVSELVDGRIEHASSGNHSQLQAGDVFLTTVQPTTPHACTAYFTDTRLITIDAAVTAEVLGLPPGDPLPALRFSGIRPRSPAATALWKRMLPRAVQLGFRRHLNTTPTQYLRRVRLAHAHDALKAADPDTDTVGAIARRWGFADPGRFKRMYRDAYGLAALQTLLR